MRPPRSILIVEDEYHLCNSLEILLEANNYKITTAKNGKDALSIIAKQTFEVVILDVHLPDMLGTEIMIKAKIRIPDIIVIIITGDANIETALVALKYGAYNYLRKPFEFEELLKSVENALIQKDLKQERDEINHKLLLSERNYRYLVENSPDIIYTLDVNGNFTFLSESIEPVLGFKAVDLIGKHYTAIVCEEERERVKWCFTERRSRKRTSSGIQLRLKRAKGGKETPYASSYLAVELKAMGMYQGSKGVGKKKYIGSHGVIRDISERQRLQAQLRNAERMESLGTLAGGIAHDFNNLLMGIQGRNALVLMDLEKTNPHFEHLQAVDEYIRSASKLTKQLLGLARGGKYEVKPTDINELVTKTIDMFGRTKKELTIQTKFNSTNLIVEVDRSQIEQTLLNLYVNAWQAMPESGELFIETKAVALDKGVCIPYQITPGCYAQISVIDTGSGMDQETLARIFDPFFSTKDKDRGTGLGLASAYGAVKNHGGMITVQSGIGRGSTFNVFLPTTKKQLIKGRAGDNQINKGSETVLLVDDEDMIIQIGKVFLEKLGYQVIAVKSGEEAVKIVHRLGRLIELVILDMIMPGMDGGKTFDRIHEAFPEIPVLLSSGYAIDDKAQKIIEKGCKGFIQKPYTFSEMSQKVIEIIGDSNKK